MDRLKRFVANQAAEEVIPAYVRANTQSVNGLIIVDSLNLLAAMCPTPKGDHAVRRSRDLLPPAAAQGAGHRHPHRRVRSNSPGSQSVAAENYFCDVEIQLSSELVVQKQAVSPTRVTTGGGLSEGWQRPDPHESDRGCSAASSMPVRRQPGAAVRMTSCPGTA